MARSRPPGAPVDVAKRAKPRRRGVRQGAAVGARALRDSACAPLVERLVGDDFLERVRSRTGIAAGVAAGVAVVGLRTSMTHDAMVAAGARATVADWTEVTPDFLRGLLE